MSKINLLGFIPLLVFLTSCGASGGEEVTGQSLIEGSGLSAHIEILASDEFQGRMPFTTGEEKTVGYLVQEFENMGLKPGNNGQFTQEVPLVEINSVPGGPANIQGNGQQLELTYLDDFVGLTRQVTDEVTVEESELIFAGYGIVAPEYQWDDYQGLDVEGKTVVVMVNDPGYGTEDSEFFKGNTMTYYGRWTYKYEEAARQGAAGILIVHDDGPAGYPWAVVRAGWSGPNQYLLAEDNNSSRCKVEGWITQDIALRLLEMAGQPAEIMQQASDSSFTAVPLNLTFNVNLKNTINRDQSRNVVAMVEGSARPDEYIIYSAHWDHLGIGEPVNGDSIYNGAEDNASGVAALLEIAQAFAESQPPPERSVVFLMVTAEEQGLLGSAYYAANPLFPAEKTVANLNIDALGSYGPTKDLVVIGYGQSELDDYAEAAAAAQGRYIVPDQEPEKGYFFRSDHFSFAKIGIPALYAEGGLDSEDQGKDWGRKQKEAYTAERYHKPSDEYTPETWNIQGMVQDTRLFYNIGNKLANETEFPEWKEGSEFKSIRDGYMK